MNIKQINNFYKMELITQLIIDIILKAMISYQNLNNMIYYYKQQIKLIR